MCIRDRVDDCDRYLNTGLFYDIITSDMTCLLYTSRECLVKPAEGDTPEVKFYKIYEPLNPDKQWRFSYTPEGVKPRDYICLLYTSRCV